MGNTASRRTPAHKRKATTTPPPISRNKREKKERRRDKRDGDGDHYDLPGGDAPRFGRIGAKAALPEEVPCGPSGGFVPDASNGAAKRDGDGDERDGRRRSRERHHRFEIGGLLRHHGPQVRLRRGADRRFLHEDGSHLDRALRVPPRGIGRNPIEKSPPSV